jgi:hypothetical protein
MNAELTVPASMMQTHHMYDGQGAEVDVTSMDAAPRTLFIPVQMRIGLYFEEPLQPVELEELKFDLVCLRSKDNVLVYQLREGG